MGINGPHYVRLKFAGKQTLYYVEVPHSIFCAPQYTVVIHPCPSHIHMLHRSRSPRRRSRTPPRSRSQERAEREKKRQKEKEDTAKDEDDHEERMRQRKLRAMEKAYKEVCFCNHHINSIHFLSSLPASDHVGEQGEEKTKRL